MSNVKESDIHILINQFKTDDELNRMSREQRLEYFNGMNVRDLKLYFGQKVSRDAYKDLILIYTLKRQ